MGTRLRDPLTKRLLVFLLKLTIRFKKYLHKKTNYVDEDSLDYFIRQSQYIPLWWGQFDWWEKYYDCKNPIFDKHFDYKDKAYPSIKAARTRKITTTIEYDQEPAS